MRPWSNRRWGILANALLHTPGETRVAIDAEISRDAVSLRIVDDGPGIPSDMLPRAFDKFVRLRRPDAGRDGGTGTGLGLAIAKGIAEAHRGAIALESPVADGRGTRVVLTFPREEVRS